MEADLFEAHWSQPSREWHDIWQRTLRLLAFERMARAKYPHPVQIVTAHDGDSLLVHVMNQLES